MNKFRLMLTTFVAAAALMMLATPASATDRKPPDKWWAMGVIANLLVYPDFCHHELSPAALRAMRAIGEATGLNLTEDSSDGGLLKYSVGLAVSELKDHPEKVPVFCNGLEKTMPMLESMGR